MDTSRSNVLYIVCVRHTYHHYPRNPNNERGLGLGLGLGLWMIAVSKQFLAIERVSYPHLEGCVGKKRNNLIIGLSRMNHQIEISIIIVIIMRYRLCAQAHPRHWTTRHRTSAKGGGLGSPNK